MGAPRLAIEVLEEAVRLKAEHGTNTAAAAACGITRPTFEHRLKQAALMGLMGTAPVLPGYRLSQTTAVTNADGDVIREFIQQKPERGEEFEVPQGHVIRGVSALTDADGRIIQQWVKTRLENVDHIEAALKETFEAYRGKAELIPPPAHTDADLATVYNIADHHLGMFAWARETGQDYDLKISEQLLKDSMATLVANAPPSETGIVLDLGDFIHSDSDENRTRRSGAALDVDTRYAKVLQVGAALRIHCVELALQRHEKVIVRCLPGNHDPYASLALSVALGAFFSGKERVTVDTDPGPFFCWQFGKVLLFGNHGDELKHNDVPGFVAATWPEIWGSTQFRYAYLGHIHHASKGGGEHHGLTYETFRTLAPKDAYHHRNGYTSGRSMVAITHHKDRGEILRHTVNVPKQSGRPHV